MTLQQLFDYLSAHPIWTMAFFIFPPIFAYFISVIGRGKGYMSPWKIIYSVLIYLVSIPGIISVSLFIYLFLFERISVWQVNLLVQVVPILSMITTLFVIQKNVDLAYIPGFGRLSGLLGMIFALFFLMYMSERFHWVTFTYMPASTVIIGFLIVLAILMWGWTKLFRSDKDPYSAYEDEY